MNDQRLQKLFAPFGKIISSKVLVDSLMQSRGKAFVQFSSPEEANRVLFEMNGEMIRGRPLYVSIAENREERKAKLHIPPRSEMAHFPSMPASPSCYQCPPMFFPQQLYFGQVGLDIMTPQPIGFCY